MLTKKSRILVLVPNGATTDNRVIREAESLKAAGHQVLVAGLRLSNLPGKRAISNKGVDVVRIDWQYRAYSKIALTYLVTVLPLLLLLSVALAAVFMLVYFSALMPMVETLYDALGTWIRGILGYYIESFSHVGTPSSEIGGMRTEAPVAYHLIVVTTLVVILRFTMVVLRRLSPSPRGSKGKKPYGSKVKKALASVARRVRHARTYGRDENVQRFTFLERILSVDESVAGSWHERVSTYWITKARCEAFVAAGHHFRPDIVHCHEIGPLPAALTLKRELGCKVIYEAHEIYDDLANASSLMSRRHQRIHRDCLPQVDGFITVNEHIGDYYQETYPGIPDPVILPNSVYPKQVEYDGRLHEAAKLPSDAKVLLYQGGFSPRRGLDILLEAAYSLPPEWYVVFMGRGPLEQSLRERSEALTIQSIKRHNDQTTLGTYPVGSNAKGKLTPSEVNLRLSGQFTKARFVPMAPHAELVEWTSGGTIGIVPYENIGLNHWNCSPNKIWEYPNAGLPLLASRLGYLNYMIQTWNIGWTLPSDPKPIDIVSAVREIESKGDLVEKQEACKAFIESDNYLVHETRLLTLIDALGSGKNTLGKAA